MTQQARDIIFYQGSEHFISPEPLESYRDLPEFMALSTANHRGYTAVWTVVVDRLFLVSLSGWADGAAEAGIRGVFPTCEAPVRADWFSGELMLQSGRLLSPSELDPLYEDEKVLYVVAGRIQSMRKLQRPRRPVQSDRLLRAHVTELDSVDSRILHALEVNHITTIGGLVRLDALDVMRAAQLDLAALAQLEAALAEEGLTFGLQVPD
ncbi:hypothetical protein LJR175_007395 [Variovorax sp. LjRoot175]|uniref:hypothetical protein n=1 Tax=Variovorax sp. LjRoot175 TaxID=3342276 RepID=UPI003ECD6F85